MQGQESGGAGDLDMGEKMPERQLGSWGERLIEVAAWGAEAPWLPCFMRRGRCGPLEERARQAALQGDGSVAASALGRLSTSFGDFNPGQPALLILVQASRLSGCVA